MPGHQQVKNSEVRHRYIIYSANLANDECVFRRVYVHFTDSKHLCCQVPWPISATISSLKFFVYALFGRLIGAFFQKWARSHTKSSFAIICKLTLNTLQYHSVARPGAYTPPVKGIWRNVNQTEQQSFSFNNMLISWAKVGSKSVKLSIKRRQRVSSHFCSTIHHSQEMGVQVNFKHPS